MKDIEKLKIDKEYYGDFGKKWLSNSDIYSLLNDPKTFRQYQKTTKAMIEGSYFHTAMLEPEKLEFFQIVEATSRNSKMYKETLADIEEDILLLRSEVENIQNCINAMKGNLQMFDQIYDSRNIYEIPMTKQIDGIAWKGKADIICSDKIIDLKTTSDISKFKYSASKYNYDSQCYLYQNLFGLPMEFYVIDKNTHQLSIFKPTEEFVEKGKHKVEQAIEIMFKFYGDKPTHDVNQYVNHELL